MMWRSAVVLAAILLASCGSGEVECQIDDAFDEASASEIRRAADAWNERTMTRLVFVPWGEWIIVRAETPERTLGHTSRRRRLLRIAPRTPAAEVYAVALHEFGHVHGLQHTATGVMSPNRQNTAFTFDDVLECERVGVCHVP